MSAGWHDKNDAETQFKKPATPAPKPKDILEMLVEEKNNPEKLYEVFKKILMKERPEALAGYILILEIDITQLIYVQISETSCGGYSLLSKAIAENDQQMIEAFKLVLRENRNFYPGILSNRRKIDLRDTKIA